MSFVALPIEIDAEALIEAVFAEMEEVFPGWEPAEGNPETFLIRAIAIRLIAPLAELAAEAGEEIFRAFGEQILNLPPLLAVNATAKSTWVVQDTAGYTIKAGTQVEVPVAGDEKVGFRVVNPVEIPEGKSETEAGEVVLEAIDPGVSANELSGTAELVDALGWVKSIALVGESSGGEDAEEPAAYLNRLAETLRTLAPRPVIAEDVAILVRNVAGVQRVCVVDNYNAETEEGEKEKTTSVYPIDAAGAAVSEAIAEDVEELLDAKREANYIFIVAKPKYNKLDVVCEIEPLPGFDKATVAENVKAAIEDFLDPANWGQAPPGDDKSWVNEPKLRYQDLVTLVNNQEGVRYYKKLEVGFSGKAKGTADIELEGKVPLTEPGTVTVT